MKSQDKNYIRMHQQIERNVSIMIEFLLFDDNFGCFQKIDKLQSSLHMIDSEKVQNKHLFYLDSIDEIKAFNPLKQFNTTEKMLMNKVNRMTLEQCDKLMKENPDLFDEKLLKSMQKKRE